MQFLNFENFITNINFLLLFLIMIFYFLQSASFISGKWSFLPNLAILISTVLQAGFLGLRWLSSGHFPLSNLYESLLFLSWILTSILAFFNSKIQNFAGLKFDQKKQLLLDKQTQELQIKQQSFSLNLVNSFLGSILTPLILLINTFANFSLPTELKVATSLVPALKSNWLMMHVTLMILSYGALLCGCLLAIAFLILQFFSVSPNLNLSKNYKDKALDKTKSQTLAIAQNEFVETPKSNQMNDNPILVFPIKQKVNSAFNVKKESYSELAEILDNLSYRILGFGFPLLTIGILSGAVWANQTWGSYWSWDPKETWALITWLLFAIYLHTRISYGWTGRQSAYIAAFGFIIIWVCYLGVNLLGKGLHSYGFFN